MVYNGILMETIGISVMVSIGLLLFLYFAGYVNSNIRKIKNKHWRLLASYSHHGKKEHKAV